MVAVSSNSHCIELICKDAREFLRVLDPINGLFESGRYIFRGVKSAAHQLVSAAHRKDAPLSSGYRTVLGPRASLHDQCAAEFYTLQEFFDIAAWHGVPIPEDSFSLRSQLDEWRLLFGRNVPATTTVYAWPPPQFFSVLGLAQHYGVPTRALDWTLSPYVAAYFSAQIDARVGKHDDRIAVWVIDDFVRRLDRRFHATSEPASPLVVFTASGSDNQNLRAQRGLFMIHQQILSRGDAPFVAAPYDQILISTMPVLGSAARPIRVLVSVEEALKVLELLSFAGLTAGALFPGLWGVAREYREARLREDILRPPTPEWESVWQEIRDCQRSGA